MKRYVFILSAAIATPVVSQPMGQYSTLKEAEDAAVAAFMAAGCKTAKTDMAMRYTATRVNASTIKIEESVLAANVSCVDTGTPTPPTNPIPVGRQTLMWTLPTKRTDGSALTATDIKHVTMYVSDGRTVTLTGAVNRYTFQRPPANGAQLWMTLEDTGGRVSASSEKYTFVAK